MTIIYKNVPYHFDLSLWGALCEHACRVHGMDDIAEMIGVHPNTVLCWIRGNVKAEFPFPSMNKFLELCNLLDVDPGQFFTIIEQPSR